MPTPTHSDREHERFYHSDLGGLSPMEIFAERAILTEALARHVYRRHRDRLIWIDGRQQITDRGWIVERLARLADEDRRRQHRRAA